jgi:hypothetical protein
MVLKGPKHVGANFKCFDVNLVLFKVYIIGARVGILKKYSKQHPRCNSARTEHFFLGDNAAEA